MINVASVEKGNNVLFPVVDRLAQCKNLSTKEMVLDLLKTNLVTFL